MAVDPEAAEEHLIWLNELEAAFQDRRVTPLSLEEWIELQASLQRACGFVDPIALGPTPERAYFILWNAWALSAELHEAIDETPWKPWASSTQFDRRAVIQELVDAMHFMANLLRAVGCTGQELTREYLKKNRRNLERQLEGYDGKLEKCGNCRRALDDLDAYAKLQVVQHAIDGKLVKFCNLACHSMHRAKEEID